jgi:glutamate 5-kinase
MKTAGADSVRERAALAGSRRVVVKLGSALLADGAPAFTRFAADIAALRARGHEVVVVSSGAIALGYPVLGYAERPSDLAGLQASAAAGQGKLIAAWAAAFAPHNIEVAQVLLTHGDLEHRRRYLNARHALTRLLECGALPIINENDTVSVDEIKLGDNDVLAAAVCGLTSSTLVVLLTSADGLFTANPADDDTAVRVPFVDEITDAVRALAGPPARLGTGGMVTKLRAAEQARAHGAATVIAPGRREHVLRDVMRGDDVGTLFSAPHEPPERAKKRWIRTALRARGTLVVDAGAARALQKASSLLLAGVREVQGEFASGAPVDIRAQDDDAPFARGIVTLASNDLRRVLGLKRDDATRVLGSALPGEIVHRDNLVLTSATEDAP